MHHCLSALWPVPFYCSKITVKLQLVNWKTVKIYNFISLFQIFKRRLTAPRVLRAGRKRLTKFKFWHRLGVARQTEMLDFRDETIT